MAQDGPKRVDEILDRLEEAGGKTDNVTTDDMTQSLGERSHRPGVPTALAVILLLFAVQVAIGRRHLWLPGFVEKRQVGSERLLESIDRLRPMARWIETVRRRAISVSVMVQSLRTDNQTFEDV